MSLGLIPSSINRPHALPVSYTISSLLASSAGGLALPGNAIPIASEIEDEKLVMNLNDSVSPVLIQDKLDKQSYFVIMPMKI